MYAMVHGEVRTLILPTPNAFVVPGVQWGSFDELFTPAYWKGQAWQHGAIGTYGNPRLGRTLAEEVAACLLGGYGMPAELGLAAFSRLRDRGLLAEPTNVSSFEAALMEPFFFQGRVRQYRFPRQKARFLAVCLATLDGFREPASDVALRDSLAQLPGVGPKTASWIVRNYRASDDVAIIDVHILRAGRHIGLFDQDWSPQRHYYRLEQSFLNLARALQISACILDGLIWDYMRRIPGRQKHKRSRTTDPRQSNLLLQFSAS